MKKLHLNCRTLQVVTIPVDLNILQIYVQVPTADVDETVIEEFYEQMKSLIKISKRNVTFIISHFNFKMSRGGMGNTL